MEVARFVSLALLLASCTYANYVPGTPGADWTQEEVDITKERLLEAWLRVADSHTESANYMYDPYSLVESSFKFYPTPAKALRLTFHDCLKYSDGTGGCDGCLNLDEMGTNRATDNNGLQPIAALLENLYRNKDYPVKEVPLPALDKSLFELGKSRADLWALAGLVAVDFFAKITNKDCNSGSESRNCDVRINGDTSQCFADVSGMKFQTGRADCVTDSPYGYPTAQIEVHPNQNGNGEQTTTFYKDNFDFSMRETVAIMGAHTIGQFNNIISGFSYSWTKETRDILNNEYFRLISARPEYALGACIGDEHRQKANSSWIALAEGKGQPTFNGRLLWFHMYNRCPDCITMPGFEDEKFRKVGGLAHCCSGLEEGQQCKPECVIPARKDETAMNCEMGLYYKFGISPDAPYKTTGCPGFDNWNFNRLTTPDCPLQDMMTEEGKPLHTVVEEYAANQQLWLDDFLAAMVKMQANGYAGGLKDGPSVVTAA